MPVHLSRKVFSRSDARDTLSGGVLFCEKIALLW